MVEVAIITAATASVAVFVVAASAEDVSAVGFGALFGLVFVAGYALGGWL